MRGKHLNFMYRRGVQPVVKVARGTDGEIRNRRLGTHAVRRNGMKIGEVEVFAVDGAAAIEVVARGGRHTIFLEKRKIELRPRQNHIAFYKVHEIPDDPRVPSSLRGARVTARADGNGKEQDPKLNRAEVFRTVSQRDPEWQELYAGRPGAESINEWLKHHLPKRRAPSLGRGPQWFDLMGRALLNNLKAEIAFGRRQGRLHRSVAA